MSSKCWQGSASSEVFCFCVGSKNKCMAECDGYIELVDGHLDSCAPAVNTCSGNMAINAVCSITLTDAMYQMSRYPFTHLMPPAVPFGLVSSRRIIEASGLRSLMQLGKFAPHSPKWTTPMPLSESKHAMPSTHHSGAPGSNIIGLGNRMVTALSLGQVARRANVMASSRLPQ